MEASQTKGARRNRDEHRPCRHARQWALHSAGSSVMTMWFIELDLRSEMKPGDPQPGLSRQCYNCVFPVRALTAGALTALPLEALQAVIYHLSLPLSQAHMYMYWPSFARSCVHFPPVGASAPAMPSSFVFTPMRLSIDMVSIDITWMVRLRHFRASVSVTVRCALRLTGCLLGAPCDFQGVC